MNISHFFEHWQIAENPFRGEEARHDSVFARMGLTTPGGVPTSTPAPSAPASAPKARSEHSEFEKILGEMTRPTTSVVFGEKGSGKTAIRLQIEDRVAAHNAAHPADKTFVLVYDDLNRFLAELDTRYHSPKHPLAAFEKMRLVDHLDAMLCVAVGRFVAGVFKESADRDAASVGEEPGKTLRSLSKAAKRDLLAMQAAYDPNDTDGSRTARLRHMLRLGPVKGRVLWVVLAAIGWAPAAGLLAWMIFGGAEVRDGAMGTLAVWLIGALALAYAGVLGKLLVLDSFVLNRLAGRLRSETRALSRSQAAVAASLAHLDPTLRTGAFLPVLEGDEGVRYESLEKFRRIIARFGYTGTLVLVDRVDEPTLVNGDADKMKLLTWPLFNNKFLQQERFGVKMLLPIELRHALFRESSSFFQEARLDKQSLVERLTWTGPMLYDLCNARLNSCRVGGSEPVGLVELFEDDVDRSDVVDALDQMQQPRDAFKFLYRCINEHCSNVTAEEGKWRIPKLVLENIRRQESERVQQLHRGIRPA